MPSVLICPTAFKGTLSPAQVAHAIDEGLSAAIQSADLKTVLLPLADGGDGTIEAVHLAAGGTLHEEQVLGPLGKPVAASWLQLGDQALVELASSCGIATLKPEELNALDANTFGLGQMILRAREFGMSTINVAVGGSASTDGGMGALRALGAAFFSASGHEVSALGGGALSTIVDADLTGLRWFLKDATVHVLTDVENPLLGQNGAAAVFGPQKGANAQQVSLLDSNLKHFADILEPLCDRNWHDVPGAGAAGGTAFGLACCLNADIVSGFDWLANATQLDAKISSTDLVITGEGRFDHQSLSGKTTGRLVQRTLAAGKPLWIVAGSAAADLALPPSVRVIVPAQDESPFCNQTDIANSICAATKAFLPGPA